MANQTTGKWTKKDRELLNKLITPNARLKDLVETFNRDADVTRTTGAIVFCVKAMYNLGVLAPGKLVQDCVEWQRTHKKVKIVTKPISAQEPPATVSSPPAGTSETGGSAFPGYARVNDVAAITGYSHGWIEVQARWRGTIHRKMVRATDVNGRIINAWVYNVEDAKQAAANPAMDMRSRPRSGYAKQPAPIQNPSEPRRPARVSSPPVQNDPDRQYILDAMKNGEISVQDARDLLSSLPVKKEEK